MLFQRTNFLICAWFALCTEMLGWVSIATPLGVFMVSYLLMWRERPFIGTVPTCRGSGVILDMYSAFSISLQCGSILAQQLFVTT